jgi:hypothetical protein
MEFWIKFKNNSRLLSFSGPSSFFPQLRQPNLSNLIHPVIHGAYSFECNQQFPRKWNGVSCWN